VLDDSRVAYSEPGVEIDIGKLTVKTEENDVGKRFTISIKMDYSIHDMTFNGDTSGNREYSPTSIPYKFRIENKGVNLGVVKIDMREVS
jgi:hypothetical protein